MPTAGIITGADPAIEDKVAFLQRPGTHGTAPGTVEVIETHMSWVFLAGNLVYKLKKPVRYEFLDFSTPEARRRDCEEEVRLNRRLAPDVYLDVVPLVITPGAALQLGGDGRPLDWLVKMRRLPRQLMLDQAIQAGTATVRDVRRCILALAAFYRDCTPVVMDAPQYRRRFIDGVQSTRRSLEAPEYGLHADALREMSSTQLAFLEQNAPLFDRRVNERRIVEGHGDLRPEHVCLTEPPLFIDCLEFNREWRLVDPADELAYLALECEHAGAAVIGEAAFSAYCEGMGDLPPESLVRFYKSYRAGIRAKLSAWHLRDHLGADDRRKWQDRAHRYLELASRYGAEL
jgi:aminoglycoside phosphotransferase family enzyme